jgi:hypothetical protein
MSDMKTSIDFLLGELLQNKLLALRYDKDDTMNEIVAKAKEIHKQEIKDAYVKGREEHYLDYYPQKHSEEYYQETFKKD